MQSTWTFALMGWIGLLANPVRLTADAASRPNIVIILADDLGFSDIGCYGGEAQTPNLDRLAANGLRFTQFYNTARCWPSRNALLTGYYAQQVNSDAGPTPRTKWAALAPELLKPAGYRSYHSGKWHVYGPVRQGGFERSYLVVDNLRYFGPRNHQLDDAPLPQPKPADGYYATTAIAQHAIDWLAEHGTKHRGEPFFLYLAFTSPHFPLQALPEDVARYRGRFKDGWDVLRRRRLERMRQFGIVTCGLSDRTPGVPAWDSLNATEKDAWEWRMALHAAMVDRMDREIGRVLDQLRKTGQWDNTFTLFCSDNGASGEQLDLSRPGLARSDGHDPAAPPGSAKTFLGLEPPWANLANAPLRKSKSFTHEGGISTPLIVHWPAGVKARGELRHTPGHFVDVVPTLLELAGAPAPAAWNGEQRPPLPGRSLVPAFANDVPIQRGFLFFKNGQNRALRAGAWKIVASGAAGPWELYDLDKDRSESHDLAARHPDKVKELAALWAKLDEEFRKQGATGAPLHPRP